MFVMTELVVLYFLDGFDDEYDDFVTLYRARLFTAVKGEVVESDEKIEVTPFIDLARAAMIEENRLKLRKKTRAIPSFALSQIAARGYADFTTRVSTELADTSDGIISIFDFCRKSCFYGF